MKRRLKVLMSSFACEPGRGSEQEVGWRWALEMARHADVVVLTQERNRPGIEQALAEHRGDDPLPRFVYLQLPGPLYGLKKRYDVLTVPYFAAWQWLALRLARILHARESFDLAHHVTFVTFRVPIYLKYLGIPVLFGPVGGAEQASWKLLRHRVPFKTRVWESFRNIMTEISARVLRWLPPIHPGLGLCLASTPGMAAVFDARGLPHRTFAAIGVERLERPRASEPPAKLARRFLFVGRLVSLKGVQLLIEAFALAGAENATLTLVGSGQEEMRLRKLADDKGLEDRVRWVGQVRREKLSAFYGSHDVLAAPSLYESGGMTVLEAMEHGRPAIVLRVGGHALSVGEDCGIPVDPAGSAAEVIGRLAEAIRRYATEEDLARVHGAEAFRKVMATYAWDRKSERMLRIYNELTGS